MPNAALASMLNLVVLDNADLHKLMPTQKYFFFIPYTSTRNIRSQLEHGGDYKYNKI
jgi:acetate kinase